MRSNLKSRCFIFIIQSYLFCANVRNAPSLAHLQKQGSSVRVRHHGTHRRARHRHLVPRYMDRGPRHTSPTTTWAEPHLNTCTNTKCILQTCTPRPKTPASFYHNPSSTIYKHFFQIYSHLFQHTHTLFPALSIFLFLSLSFFLSKQ